MGYTKRENTEITDFWPDDDANTIYMESNSISLEEILVAAHTKWPNANPSEIKINAERIHTSCIYYDLYDPNDFTNFVVISYQPA